MGVEWPSRVWLDVPFVEDDLARAAGALWSPEAQAFFVDPAQVPRGRVALWLPPRLAVQPGKPLAPLTVYAVPYRCYRCRAESLAVVAYRGGTSQRRDDRPRRSGSGQVSAYWDWKLEFVAAALHGVDVPHDLASLRRRYSGTMRAVYMSNECPNCQAIFGSFLLGDKYTRGQNRKLAALLPIVTTEVPEVYLTRAASSQSTRELQWSDADWPELLSPPAWAALERERIREEIVSRRQSSPAPTRPSLHPLWGCGTEVIGKSTVTKEELLELLDGRWDGRQLVAPGRSFRFDRRTGGLVRVPARKIGFESFLLPGFGFTELLLASDDETASELMYALEVAARAAVQSLEDHARVARVPPQIAGVEPKRLRRTGSRLSRSSWKLKWRSPA